MKVVFTVLDALPVRHVGTEHTPTLNELGRTGGFAVDGARAVMTSATYPNHATFATGTDPARHGVATNWVPEPGRVVPAWKLPLRVPTVFDACRRGGRSSAAVLGDQHLVGVMGATEADRHWPPDGELPEGTRLDAMGYVDDRDTVREIVDAIDAMPDLLISHLNGPDTAAHLFGPDSDDALAGYRDTDAALAIMREHVAWDDTVWILVSDHDQENVTVREPVDLQTEISARGLELFALPEGSASLVCGDGAERARAWLDDVDGVEGTASFTLTSNEALECCLVWSEPGRAFGFAGEETRLGTHGGPRTRAQVAVVAGGHAAVEPLARALRDTPIAAADWAPTIAALLDLELPTATGRALV
jgi:arylsulfatase A-like enzyme